jgi:hypothetical protein
VYINDGAQYQFDPFLYRNTSAQYQFEQFLYRNRRAQYQFEKFLYRKKGARYSNASNRYTNKVFRYCAPSFMYKFPRAGPSLPRSRSWHDRPSHGRRSLGYSSNLAGYPHDPAQHRATCARNLCQRAQEPVEPFGSFADRAQGCLWTGPKPLPLGGSREDIRMTR